MNEMFTAICKNKKTYLFGATKISRDFMDKYGNKYFICGILDNAKEKQGKGFYQDTFIMSPEILRDEKSDDVVVLIASRNYHAQINEQLQNMGIRNTFVLNEMKGKTIFRPLKIFENKVSGYFESKILSKYGWNKKSIMYSKWMKLCRNFPVENNKILIAGEHYREHGKYISDALLPNQKGVDVVWVLKDINQCPNGARCVYADDIKQFIYELSTARIWINSDVFPIYVKKRKEQIYIQTKHWSSITLKKFYFDTPIHYKTRPWIKKLWRKDVKMIDYIMVGSEFDRRTCEAGFKYHGKFANVGSPRTDALFTPEVYREKIYNRYDLKKETNIVLYAPTFRVKEKEGVYNPQVCDIVPNFNKMVQVLAEKFEGYWTVALRLHPAAAHQSAELCKDENVVDMSRYEDIQELLAVSDIIITDYSSLMFEPAMVGKKVFLFTPDLEEYCAKERELWFDIKELPFTYAISEEDLYNNILHHDEAFYQKNIKQFFDSHGVAEDGHASERAAEFILDLIKE